VLVYLIGAWALVTGVLEVAAAIKLRQFIAGEWLLALSGIASLLFGILVLAMPLAGALAIAMLTGVYSVAFGFILVGFGIRLRSWSKTRKRRRQSGFPLTEGEVVIGLDDSCARLYT
jgi:uncharacterized membrane protein HdeD (DUF308 family)